MRARAEELAQRIAERLRAPVPVDCTTLTDAELWKMCGMIGPEDLDETERRIVAALRAEVVADPRGWVRDYLALPEGIDKEVTWALYCFVDRVEALEDPEVRYGTFIADHELRAAGVRLWYERS